MSLEPGHLQGKGVTHIHSAAIIELISLLTTFPELPTCDAVTDAD